MEPSGTIATDVLNERWRSSDGSFVPDSIPLQAFYSVDLLKSLLWGGIAAVSGAVMSINIASWQGQSPVANRPETASESGDDRSIFLPPFSKEQVERVAALARIRLTGSEVYSCVADFVAIMARMDVLGRLDVDAVDPTWHPIAVRNAWREDVAEPSLSREEVGRNAPSSELGFFKVPPVIE